MSEEEKTIPIEELTVDELRETVASQHEAIMRLMNDSASSEKDNPAAKVNYLKIRTAGIELEMQSPDATNTELTVAAKILCEHIDTAREMSSMPMAMGMPPSTYV